MRGTQIFGWFCSSLNTVNNVLNQWLILFFRNTFNQIAFLTEFSLEQLCLSVCLLVSTRCLQCSSCKCQQSVFMSNWLLYRHRHQIEKNSTESMRSLNLPWSERQNKNRWKKIRTSFIITNPKLLSMKVLLSWTFSINQQKKRTIKWKVWVTTEVWKQVVWRDLCEHNSLGEHSFMKNYSN